MLKPLPEGCDGDAAVLSESQVVVLCSVYMGKN